MNCLHHFLIHEFWEEDQAMPSNYDVVARNLYQYEAKEGRGDVRHYIPLMIGSNIVIDGTVTGKIYNDFKVRQSKQQSTQPTSSLRYFADLDRVPILGGCGPII